MQSNKQVPRLAVFASGSGSNAQRLVEFFSNTLTAQIVSILSNNPKAGVLARANQLGVESFVFDKEDFYQTPAVLDYLKSKQIDWVILAGFLWLVPSNLLQAYPHKVINLHPALLPKFGGKGMYGMNVHKAVVAAQETETGITIHYANEQFDEGEIIYQAKCAVSPTDSPEAVAEKIHQLEYKYFPQIIEQVLTKAQIKA